MTQLAFTLNSPEIPDSSKLIVPARDIRVGDVLDFAREGGRSIPVTAVGSYWRNPLSVPGTNMVVTGNRVFMSGDTEGWAARPERLLPVVRATPEGEQNA